VRRFTVSLILVTVLLRPCAFCADDPFESRKSRDIAILGASTAFLILGTAAYLRPAPSSITNPDRRRIFGPDRFAVDCSSSAAGTASDVFMSASVAMPMVFFTKKTFTTDLLMLAESNILCQGLTQLSKGMFHRPRPFVYRSDQAGKQPGRDAFRSFFSGHTSAAFNGAVLAGTVFAKRHPGSRRSTAVWATGLTLAAATGTCRVLAGRHFPTDVLAGAAAGAFTGWLIPRLHLGGG
jgi:membrane-associated phospholipid phosphatase